MGGGLADAAGRTGVTGLTEVVLASRVWGVYGRAAVE